MKKRVKKQVKTVRIYLDVPADRLTLTEDLGERVTGTFKPTTTPIQFWADRFEVAPAISEEPWWVCSVDFTAWEVHLLQIYYASGKIQAIKAFRDSRPKVVQDLRTEKIYIEDLVNRAENPHRLTIA